MAKGWLKIEGVQDGERTLQEQMLGLDDALALCKNKSVLDMGCAEGTIGIEFAKAGASRVVGYDYKKEFVAVANTLAAKHSDLPLKFFHADISTPRDYGQFDIVLALAILHKLPNPRQGAELCARIAKELIVVRLPLHSTGLIKSKHAKHMICDLPNIFTACGWKLSKTEEGPRKEIVHYWTK